MACFQTSKQLGFAWGQEEGGKMTKEVPATLKSRNIFWSQETWPSLGAAHPLRQQYFKRKGLISTESNKLGEYVRSTFCGFCPPCSGFGVSFLERCEVGASPMWWLSPPSGAWEILACCVKTKAGPSWGFPACCVGQKASEAVMDGPGLWVNVEEVHFVW